MPIPEPLRQCIESATSCIERADPFNITSLASIAEERLRTARSYAVPTAASNEAFDDAIMRVLEFHEEVVDQNTLVQRVTSAIEQARQLALIAIQRFAKSLEEAKASDLAKAMDEDWW